MSIVMHSVISKQIMLKKERQCNQQTNNAQKGKAMENKKQSSIVASNNHREGAINVPKTEE